MYYVFTKVIFRIFKNLIFRHNFIEKHFTTKKIPAVTLNIVENGFTFEQYYRPE
jgi:hypothetical protein